MSSSNEPTVLDKRDAKAQAKADKAYQKASRPWFKKKRYLVPLVLLVIIIIASLGGGGGNTSSAGDDTEATNSGSTENTGDVQSENGSDAAETEPEANPFDEQYGTFKPIKESGNGDATLTLPESASAAIVTMKHNGSANFSVVALDANNQPTGDLLANTIGSYSGTAAYGLTDMGEPVKLKITADGRWNLNVKPISAAKELPTSANGQGDAVYLYTGDAADWALQHNGSANFAVIQYGGMMPNLMVNEIGSYKGTVPAVEGPSVVTITADGQWSIDAT